MDQNIVNFILGLVSAVLIGFTTWIFKSIIALKDRANSMEMNYKDRFAKVNYDIAEVKAEMNLRFEEIKNFIQQENITTRHSIRDAIHTMQMQLSENYMTLEDHEKICKYNKKED